MGSHWISWDLVLPRSTTGGRKKYRNSLWRFFAAMQEKSRGNKKRRGSTKMPQIRNMVVDNILVKCPATTSLAAMPCHPSDFV